MDVNQNEGKVKKTKRMLSAKKEGQKWFVEINFSSLDLIQTCLRKAYYVLDQELVSQEEPQALAFGTSIHKALEHWYTLPAEQRELSSADAEEAQFIGAQQNTTTERTGALESVRRFVEAGRGLSSLDSTDKRSLSNGIKILTAYFKLYKNDGLEIVRDAAGPCIEREISFVLHDSPELQITYFGTIDLILRNKHSGLIMVADHKTTHALGSEFYQRCKPNHQYCGYVLAAQQVLGLTTNLFMVNGIQVAKTKQEFARQVVEFQQEDFDDLKQSVVARVKHYIQAKEASYWPMTSPGPCSNYGGCAFLDVCSVPKSIRQNVIEAKFKQRGE